jgi:hypothetical protein
MPLHDSTLVEAGTFHDSRTVWMAQLTLATGAFRPKQIRRTSCLPLFLE